MDTYNHYWCKKYSIKYKGQYRKKPTKARNVLQRNQLTRIIFFVIIASCSYYGPMRKASDWLTKIKDEDGFGFGMITAIQSDPDLPMKFNDAWNHQDQEQ